ncbi:polysaccharide deacetylase family protein [Candidatus Woesearchaeota archaeon]|nr:polysaccharide deacetylase family protein [Candidatus Woesearchaeota archaeon]
MYRKNTDHPELKRLNIAFAVFVVLLVVLLIAVALKKAPAERVVLLSFDVEPVDGEDSLKGLLDILDKANVTATFFITGEYAEAYPGLVRRIASSPPGHEIGCHTYSHPVLTKLDKDAQQEEIKRCVAVLEAVSGQKVLGFRAPYHRIDGETYDVLEEERFLYDASIIRGISFVFPSVRGRDIGEIPVSSVMGLAIEDVIWVHYLHMDRAFFYILRNKNSELESYLFHPRQIMKNSEEFDEFLNFLNEENVMFISHVELIKMHNEGLKTCICQRQLAISTAVDPACSYSHSHIRMRREDRQRCKDSRETTYNPDCRALRRGSLHRDKDKGNWQELHRKALLRTQ